VTVKADRFPVGRWGVIKNQPNASRLKRVRIDVTNRGRFEIVANGVDGGFEVWVDSEDEVLEFLESLDVHWEQ
jgi:hypothetical protein